MIKTILAIVGDVEVLPSVIVVVAHAYPLPPSACRESSLHRHIGKSSIVIISVQMIGRGLSPGKSFEGRAIHQKNIRPAIIVIIEDCRTRSGSLDDVFLRVLPSEDVQ